MRLHLAPHKILDALDVNQNAYKRSCYKKNGNVILLKYSLKVDPLFSLPIVQKWGHMPAALKEEALHHLQMGMER
jgi:hypothetical protein